jgi:hypothetical protein
VRVSYCCMLATGIILTACMPRSDLTPAQAAAISDSVRAFTAAVAHAVTRDGPIAWRGQFADSPAFFMASDGRLVFSSSAAATHGIQELTHLIRHIDLQWGDSLRIDPVAPGLAVVAVPYHEVRVDTAGHRVEEAGFFTGLAQHGTLGWQFRNAHWSVLGPVSRVR